MIFKLQKKHRTIAFLKVEKSRNLFQKRFLLFNFFYKIRKRREKTNFLKKLQLSS
ncbi:hypothetical protein HCB00_10275 [Listeria innocua]|uniref:hypothetical protein n=1 Tax=Listeria innocua TaxID=1642 RepID=UPI00162AE840|nr:hypothetical protein [Listeria innocua]